MLNIEKKVQEIDFNYRPTLNIPNSVLFGTEIEFVKALYEEVIKKIEIFNSTDKTKYINLISYYGDFFNYNKWKCVGDYTVNEIDENGQIYGGEINSPILSNYTYNFTSSTYDLINSINNFKKKNNLLKLRVDNKIPEFIVNWPVELMLN